ncbi:MAG: hypothetical protein GY742_06470 [Hyphomicrobiales bacterium]|nr:hypothetical protein [Hyphomicrobiales bacterium]
MTACIIPHRCDYRRDPRRRRSAFGIQRKSQTSPQTLPKAETTSQIEHPRTGGFEKGGQYANITALKNTIWGMSGETP